MTPFTTLTGIAAPLPMANIDTDKIIPARFMKTIQRAGLGKSLFDGLRYQDCVERSDFILSQAPYRDASILITHDNFGCGSSREHAPWALLDFGIRCIIAPSFADIFYGNCFKNGILPICLPLAICDSLMADARMGSNAMISIDLEKQAVVRPSGEAISFDIAPARRQILLQGLDDITQTLQRVSAIDSYEKHAESKWVQFYPGLGQTAKAEIF